MLIYLLNNRKLPWRGLEAQFSGKNSFQKSLKERVRKKYTIKLFSMIPQDLQSVLKELLCINFKARPPYEKIQKAMMSCLRRVKANFIPRQPVHGQHQIEESKEEENDSEVLMSHTYEWKRNLASQVKLRLMQQSRD